MLGEDATLADRSWRTVLDNGGAVVWTATLYDVDSKSYFLMAFDRQALRIYRYGELAGPFETHLGMPRFVGRGSRALLARDGRMHRSERAA